LLILEDNQAREFVRLQLFEFVLWNHEVLPSNVGQVTGILAREFRCSLLARYVRILTAFGLYERVFSTFQDYDEVRFIVSQVGN
jgi:hypothetical protein